MEIRFPGLVKYEADIPESINKRFLPPLSLQLVVENALKHNSVLSGDELYIRIYCSDNKYIIIENNTIKGPNHQIEEEKAILSDKKTSSTKVGLKNLKERFAYLSQNPVFIENTNVFSVKLPIINHPEKSYAPEIT
jgi:LytS/YehU family sensor histidine kinase